MKSFPLEKVYQLLEPGPVVLLTTAARDRPNVMAMSWHMMVEFEPPLIACIVSDRNHSFKAFKAAGQCVIALPAARLASTVAQIGNCSGRDIDKFDAFGLTPLPARKVKAPLIAECFANLECRIVDTHLANKYCLFVLQVLKAWHDPAQKDRRTLHHCGLGTFTIDGRKIRVPSKMR